GRAPFDLFERRIDEERGGAAGNREALAQGRHRGRRARRNSRLRRAGLFRATGDHSESEQESDRRLRAGEGHRHFSVILWDPRSTPRSVRSANSVLSASMKATSMDTWWASAAFRTICVRGAFRSAIWRSIVAATG